MTMKKNLAFVFPGQGSQVEHMLNDCADHPIVRSVLGEANETLGYDLGAMILNGSAEALNRTEVTQPALLTVSTALWRLWCSESDLRPAIMAGHSLGEYSALVAAGVIEFAEAVRLVSLRGQYMQSAVPEGKGAMAAILGLTDEIVTALCMEASQGDVLAAVNFNSPGQVVIAGTKEAVDRGCVLAKEKGARRALPLPVSAPSHCALMKPAADQLAIELGKIKLSEPIVSVLHNVDVKRHTKKNDIMQALVEQLYQPVRWTETINAMSTLGVTTIIECGPGKVLTGLIKRIDKEIKTANVFDYASVKSVLESVDI